MSEPHPTTYPVALPNRLGTAAHEAMQRYAPLLDQSLLGAAIVSADGRWEVINDVWAAWLGYSGAALHGQTLCNVLDPDDAQAWTAVLTQATDGPVRGDYRMRRADGGTLWVQLAIAPAQNFADAPSGYLFAQACDISAYRDASQAHASQQDLQAQLAERDAQLLHSQRQHQAFAHGVSHDLRAPLRAIDGFANLLSSHAGPQLDDTGRDYIARIRNAIARMGGLIDGLLELSRVDRAQLRMQDVDVSMLADWVGAELQDAAPAHAAQIEVAPGLMAHSDERLLKQLLSHVMHNAWKFSGDAPVRITVEGERLGNQLQLRVRDVGCGFDMAYVDKLFQPFQRLHDADEGSGHGLGLAIAQRIAERLGGHIEGQSPGKQQGCVFTLVLPAAQQSP